MLALAEKAFKSVGEIDAARAAVDADPSNLAARQDLAMALLQLVSKQLNGSITESIRINLD